MVHGRGVVWVDRSLDTAHVNPAAADLLDVPPGEVLACDFIAAMKRLRGRALNRGQIAPMGFEFFDNLSEDIDFTMFFAESPTRVHVSSYAAHQDGFSGSVWAFEDVSANAQTVKAHLQAALSSQVVIEQAKGILAERGNIDMARASALLSAHARSTGERLADIAAKIVAGDALVIIEGLNTTDEARAQQAKADARFRRTMQYAGIGMCLVAPGGRFTDVNDALCQFLGYDAEILVHKTWQELTAPEYMDEDQKNVDDLLAGRRDAYRVVKQYIHADGHRVWGDLSVSCVRDENGQVESFISQITDITALMEANEHKRVLAQQLQQQTDRLASELRSAANYMASIMPKGLSGEISVSSRYLPSRQLGGDSFHYRWIDEDHLLVYLIDVSGHGLEPALLSVSLHNMLRSGSFAAETLLIPEAVLTELNRLFQMEQQSDHYSTMWYGVYQVRTRTLRYASAGSPPALAFTPATGSAGDVTELLPTSAPVGIFEDTVFTSRTYQVPPGCRILIYSDGASEITLTGNRQLSFAEFKNLCARLAHAPDWTLDEIIDQLRALTPTGVFEDDFSLIRLDVP